MERMLAKLGQFNHWHKLDGSGWLVASYYGSPKRNRAMLTGSDLLAKVDQLRSEQPGITNTELVLACGYIKPDGKASYVAFYEALIAAKQPKSMVSDEIETDLEFSDEEELEKFEELCESYPQEAVEIYYEKIGNFDDFEEAYEGEFESEAYFTEEILANICGRHLPSWIVIDYQATWDSMLRFDYWEEDNFFFRNI
jgi:hypothetical protein